MEKAIEKLKNGKAAGEDGIGNKVWREGGIKKIAWEVYNMMQRQDWQPEEKKVGVIVQIKKKQTKGE